MPAHIKTQVAKGEVLPVPLQLVPEVWATVHRRLRKVPKLDLPVLHQRLLLGTDKLWVVVKTAGYEEDRWLGILITTVTMRPPSQRKIFTRSRSLIVHLAEGKEIVGWIDSAVERINRYGQEMGCRQLFLKASIGWREYAMRFYSRRWDIVAYSRDRPRGVRTARRRDNGAYRVCIPVPPTVQFKEWWYAFRSKCLFKEHAA